MTETYLKLIDQVRQLPIKKRGQLLRAFFDDPDLRDDLLDLAALIEAETEEGEPMELEEFISDMRNQ